MEQLHNGFTLQICPGGFPLSTDSVLLSAFARLPKHAQVLDLGSGCGTLGVLLCASDPNCCVTGIELDAAAHEQALQNISRNALDCRMKSICANLTAIPEQMAPGSFSVCISNPPYFSAGPQSQVTPHARHDDFCTPEALFRSAAWALRYGGDFFLVHKPERLAQLCHLASQNQLEPKRLQLVRHRSDGPVSLILLACRKGAKPGLIWEELTLHHPDGTPTEDYRKLYHL